MKSESLKIITDSRIACGTTHYNSKMKQEMFSFVEHFVQWSPRRDRVKAAVTRGLHIFNWFSGWDPSAGVGADLCRTCEVAEHTVSSTPKEGSSRKCQTKVVPDYSPDADELGEL